MQIQFSVQSECLGHQTTNRVLNTAFYNCVTKIIQKSKVQQAQAYMKNNFDFTLM